MSTHNPRIPLTGNRSRQTLSRCRRVRACAAPLLLALALLVAAGPVHGQTDLDHDGIGLTNGFCSVTTDQECVRTQECPTGETCTEASIEPIRAAIDVPTLNAAFSF